MLSLELVLSLWAAVDTVSTHLSLSDSLKAQSWSGMQADRGGVAVEGP